MAQEKALACTSCKVKLTSIRDSTKFKCPECSEMDIVRCGHCREIGARYICSKCGFNGPN